jgi:hypothetical protein
MSAFSTRLQLGGVCFGVGLAGVVESRHGSSADIADGPDDSHPWRGRRLGSERGFRLGPWGFPRIGPIVEPQRLGCFRLGPKLPQIECASCHETVDPVLEVLFGFAIANSRGWRLLIASGYHDRRARQDQLDFVAKTKWLKRRDQAWLVG